MAKLPDRADEVIEPQEDRAYTFERSKRYHIALSDFIRSTLAGDLCSTDQAVRTNFEECVLRDLTCETIHFSGCDFLDSHVMRSRFMACNFDQTHFAGCLVRNVKFASCRFYLTNDTETVFTDCEFSNCVFERFIFKYCRFVNCSFSGCTTTNKLFDSCSLIGCRFHAMTLQVSTVLSNVGLHRDDFSDCTFRTERSYEDHHTLNIDQLVSLLEQGDEDLFKAATAAYFVEGPGPCFHERVDALFADLTWFGNFVSKAINEKLERLATLLFHLYESDQILVILIFKLQDFLNSLSLAIREPQSHHSRTVAQAVDGLRLQTARQIQKVLDLIQSVVQTHGGEDRLLLDGEGPTSREFYAQLLDHLPPDSVRVSDVRPRNSPLLIQVDLLTVGAYAWIIALLLCTRLRYQVTSAIASQVQPGQAKRIPSRPAKALKKAQLPVVRSPGLDLQLGSLNDEDGGFGVQAMAIFSSGLCHQFHLSFSMRRAFALHRHFSRVIGSIESTSKDHNKT